MKLTLLLITTFFITGCATSNKSEEYDAKKTIVKMVNAIDTHNWKMALAQFDTTVFIDYSSMTGQAGAETKAKDLVGNWEKILKKAKTHHILANFETSINGNTAEVFSHVYASHDAKGIQYWDIYGRYHHKLKKTKDGWKITFMKLIVHGQKGNLKFLQQVSKK